MVAVGVWKYLEWIGDGRMRRGANALAAGACSRAVIGRSVRASGLIEDARVRMREDQAIIYEFCGFV